MESKKNNLSQSDILEVKVHPHIVGGVKQTIDSNGKAHVVASALVNMYDKPCTPEFGKPMTSEKILEAINNKIAAIGLFSSRFVNVDEFTNINYTEDSTNLIYHKIDGTEDVDIYYPHDRITYHISNEWIFQAFQIQFLLEKGLYSFRYLNLPTIINIKRSSGSIQKGILKSNESLRLRQRSKDNELQIYIKVHFSIYDPEETREEECTFTKTIYLQDLVDLNPEFNTLEVTKPSNILKDVTLDTEVKKKVITKIKEDYLGWFSTKFLPVLQNLKGITIHIKN